MSLPSSWKFRFSVSENGEYPTGATNCEVAMREDHLMPRWVLNYVVLINKYLWRPRCMIGAVWSKPALIRAGQATLQLGYRQFPALQQDLGFECAGISASVSSTDSPLRLNAKT